jgi:hypothetical protein
MHEAKRRILQMLQEGTINAAEAARLLDALGGDAQVPPRDEPPAAQPEPANAEAETPAAFPPDGIDVARFRRFWRVPFIISLAVLAVTGFGMWSNYAAYGFITLPFACLWAVFFGAALAAGVSLWSRTATWMHLRVRGADTNLRISLPLPVGLAAWAVRLARPFLCNRFKETGLDELILSLEGNVLAEGPLYVEVRDDADGEHVQVYIG